MNLGKQLGWIEGNLDVGRVKVVLPLLSFHWEKLKVVLMTLHRDAFRTQGHTRERCIFHSDCERSVSVRCQWWRHLIIAKTAEGNTEHLCHTHTHDNINTTSTQVWFYGSDWPLLVLKGKTLPEVDFLIFRGEFGYHVRFHGKSIWERGREKDRGWIDWCDTLLWKH